MTFMELSEKTCTACRAGAPLATEAEIASLLPQIPQWQIEEVDGVKHLSRVYVLNNFVEALELANKVGALAETEGHHPALLTEWGRLTVFWWTHKIRGLHVNDFVMAAKTDGLLKSD
jgi:4a-hydroxytetrahydrobiopterin dehydratase